MKRTENITPENNRRVVEHLVQYNAELHDRLLTEHKWYVDDEVCEMIRVENEALLVLLLKRTAEFASFRTRRTSNNALIKATNQDIDNAWDSIQLDRQKEEGRE